MAPCPLDAPFGIIVDCFGGVIPMETSGGYDGVLVFVEGGEPDTLSNLSYKVYSDAASILSLVAGFGLVSTGGKGDYHYHLYYARVNGVEHGVPRYPTAAELPAPQVEDALMVWPNPAQEWVRVAFTPEEGGVAGVEVHDVRGRQVFTQDVTALPGVRAEAALDLSGLAPGVYVVRLAGQGGVAPVRLAVLGR
jgi:hypothetical protein